MADEKRKCSETSCSGDCSNCASAKKAPADLHASMNEYSNAKKVIGVVSGKGGVGKSLVSAGLALSMRRLGYETGILDADITGPSIPKMFGVNSRAMQNETGILPAVTETGIKMMSINLLLESAEAPVV